MNFVLSYHSRQFRLPISRANFLAFLLEISLAHLLEELRILPLCTGGK